LVFLLSGGLRLGLSPYRFADQLAHDEAANDADWLVTEQPTSTIGGRFQAKASGSSRGMASLERSNGSWHELAREQ
jgi:hypothetical protein